MKINRVIKNLILFVLVVSFPLSGFGATSSRSVTINGSQSSWLNTGIVLDGKNAVRITATGMINYCSGGPQCDATPDGSVSGEAHCGGGPTDAGGALCGALIARVGGVGGVTFIIGTGLTIPKFRKGRLEIGIQDFLFEDNTGSFKVKIKGFSRQKYDLSGYVLGSNQTPFPKERVFARGKAGRYSARTDASGRYQFRDLPEGKYVIVVERAMKFPNTFSPLDNAPLNFAFAPRRIQVNLTDDLSNQNFTARRFSTLKAPLRKVRKYKPNQLCTLSPAQQSGAVAQVRNIENGTRLRMSDSFFASGFVVTVIGEGPFNLSKFSLSRLECVGEYASDAGIGLPLNSGGAEDRGVAVIELAPKR